MTSEARPARELARQCRARSKQLMADAGARAKPVLLALRGVIEMTLVVLLGLTVWGGFQICSVAANLAVRMASYFRNPGLAALDAVSLYGRTRYWLQMVAASFILSLTSWGDGWASAP